jgi:hypothetical protein
MMTAAVTGAIRERLDRVRRKKGGWDAGRAVSSLPAARDEDVDFFTKLTGGGPKS